MRCGHARAVPTFLDLLYDEAPRADYDALVTSLVAAGADPEATRRECDVALRLRDLVARQRAREAELSALYETAHDLTALRDVDAVLSAIVRRARQLLKADMTYLSLNDVDADSGEGASYMKVTDGALTAEFERLRLPLGTGLLGLVAQTGAPYFTADYQSDERFEHRGYIDEAVDGERIRAILGVPLLVEGRFIGALLATHRTVRPFPPEEVSLLTSFAAHAAVALENARLFADLDDAARRIGEQAAAVDRAAAAHDRLTALVLRGSPLEEVVEVLGEVLGHPVTVRDREGRRLAGPEPTSVAEEVPVVAGSERLGSLVLLADGAGHGERALDPAERRILERGAVVVALVLLFARSEEATEARLGGALLADLLRARPDRGELGRLRARAVRQGAELDGPCVLAVAEVEGVEVDVAARAASRAAWPGPTTAAWSWSCAATSRPRRRVTHWPGPSRPPAGAPPSGSSPGRPTSSLTGCRRRTPRQRAAPTCSRCSGGWGRSVTRWVSGSRGSCSVAPVPTPWPTSSRRSSGRCWRGTSGAAAPCARRWRRGSRSGDPPPRAPQHGDPTAGPGRRAPRPGLAGARPSARRPARAAGGGAARGPLSRWVSAPHMIDAG